jgi:Flp pilus assembly protein CpaB
MSLLQTAPGHPGNSRGTPSRATRRWPRRLSKGHWVALAVGLLAALINIAVLRDRREMTAVAVARGQIESADQVTGDMVRWVEVPADSPLAEGLVDESLLAGGLVATRPIAAGEPITARALAPEVTGGGLRAMSVPVAREHAAGGVLRPGDRVDVIDVVDGEPTYVVTDAEVLSVASESTGSLGAGPGQFHVVVAVDDREALGLARASADDKLEVVRSTGAAPVDAEGSTTSDATGGRESTDG